MAVKQQEGGNEAVGLEKLACAISARWAAEHEGTTLLSVGEAFELGRAISKRIAPDLFGARNQPGPDNGAAARRS